MVKIALYAAMFGFAPAIAQSTQTTEPAKGSPYSLIILIGIVALVIFLVRRSSGKKDANAVDKNTRRSMLAGWLLIPVFLFISLAALGNGNSGLAAILLIVTGIIIYKLWRQGGKIKASREAEHQHSIAVREQVNAIFDGELPIVTPRKAIVRKDEISHFAGTASLSEKQTTGYSHGGASVRFRVAKGVSIGTSGGRSRAIKENLIVANGEFVITNKRIIFAGDRKSFESTLYKLTSFETYADGIVFHIDTKSYTLFLDEPELADAVLNNLLR
ncbi:hypothetical protein [Pectobacterium aroidearum]|uniref:hypothetical protein n=1 Tax=Pectobacterium aroidearum TaxID=1201031 RepID=UPI0033152134